jgi:hypothetical protein
MDLLEEGEISEHSSTNSVTPPRITSSSIIEKQLLADTFSLITPEIAVPQGKKDDVLLTKEKKKHKRRSSSSRERKHRSHRKKHSHKSHYRSRSESRKRKRRRSRSLEQHRNERRWSREPPSPRKKDKQQEHDSNKLLLAVKDSNIQQITRIENKEECTNNAHTKSPEDSEYALEEEISEEQLIEERRLRRLKILEKYQEVASPISEVTPQGNHYNLIKRNIQFFNRCDRRSYC